MFRVTLRDQKVGARIARNFGGDAVSEILVNVDTHRGPSFSLSNRLRRVLWGVAWVALFRWTPRPAHRWRAFVLRLFGAEVGRGSHVYPSVKIWAPWNVRIGEESGIGDGVNLYSMAPITVGDRVTISQGAHLCCGTHDISDWGAPLLAFPISIGNHAWIFAEAFLAPGVEIGEGAVVGARSVVTKSMPAWMVCVGNPCRPIKPRIMKERR
ncbi:DapH/DapD/GlmU-related protein [Fimbriimonas ginsengisoli]|uniref:DapH/DapD/GlmU-related protein n=1 Tax=Fimbriimonas ginsengisoli TaxID=1005039 RepID=UPI000A06F76C